MGLSTDQIPAGLVRDKQLQFVDILKTLFKWNNGMALNLKEVAVVTGYDYGRVRRWGVPLFAGKITKSEFESWKRREKTQAANENVPGPNPTFPLGKGTGPATAARQRRLAAAKFGQHTCQ